MKNFIRNNLKTILVAGVTAIICISGTAFAAYQYQASKIEYKDGKSVEEALNDLFNKNNNTTKGMTLIASNQSGRYANRISVKNITGYESLTKDDFFVVLTGIDYVGTTDSDENYNLITNYNSEKGELEISTCKVWFKQGRTLTIWTKYDVYLNK